jgi:MoxR-like ATPase
VSTIEPTPSAITTPPPAASPELAHDVFQRINDELRKIIVGQDAIVTGLLVSMFSNGHCLLIGVPGLAKTLLVRSLAEVLNLDFKRIQFTPDLMPSDILGSEFLKDHGGTMEFEFQQGPIFTNLLLADEINRTPPKTQSALLEAMQERHVTVAGESRDLTPPFLVVATQNPIEHEGTYPLPEAQLDRFMFSLNLGYPSKDEEIEVVRRTTFEYQAQMNPVVSGPEILAVQELVRAMPVADHILEYAVDLATATRPNEENAPEVSRNYIEWGAGPRASQYLILGAKALAILNGRSAPEAEDVRNVALPVLQHRIVPNYRATGEGKKPHHIITDLIPAVKEPQY